MSKTNKLKIFNDPIYGFIGVPNEFIFQLIEHPYFQRLRRISQMGMSYLVYPGAHHTRFHHALGAMHLMQKAIEILKYKDVTITDAEENALLAAILLHDMGHGPFSHALEGKIVLAQGHEEISLAFMNVLNVEFNGGLDLAIQIFKSDYHKPFMNELVSSQLDMDRLDYLKRDSFYTGITEGNINSERLITMLNVADGHLVVEEKGMYAVEKFLMARRFMYWQAYLHKTGLVAELLLIKIIERVKNLLNEGIEVECSDSLLYFLSRNEKEILNDNFVKKFTSLDDVDMLSAIKKWQHHPDKVLSKLCSMILNRELLKIKIRNKPIKEQKLAEKLDWVKTAYAMSLYDASYFVF